MFAPTDLAELHEKCLEGKWLKLARAITRVEEADPWDLSLPQPTKPTHVIGITGPPGAGKSTLTSTLIQTYADDDKRVCVLAIDPSSPISGGAVLGDRLRMEKSLLGRTNVYVRSLASRGAHGAVAPATRNVARLCELTEAFDVIIIETVGAGQSEVAIAELADTVCLVTVPGLGDAVQAIKAGFLEVANLVVVNKADKPDAPETIRHLKMNLDHHQEVLATIAMTLEGVPELRAAFDARWNEITSAAGDLTELRAGKFAQEAAMLAEAWTASIAAGIDIDSAEGFGKAVKKILEEAAARWTI